jgi:hypothetical protein
MNRFRSSWHSAFVALTAMSAAAASIAACYSGDKLGQQNNNQPAPSSSSAVDAGPPFEPDSPAVYVQKAKDDRDWRGNYRVVRNCRFEEMR